MYGYRTYHFTLSISRDEMLRYYRGEARHLVVRSQEGLVLDLPAERLRPFISTHGIYGQFVLTVNSANKFISLKQIS